MVASYDITKHYSVSNHLIELLNYGQWSYYLNSVYTAETYTNLYLWRSPYIICYCIYLCHTSCTSSAIVKYFKANTDNSHSVSDHMCSNLCYFRCIYSNNFVLFPFKPSVHLVYWKRLVSTVAVSAGTLPPRLLVITNYTHMKWSSTQLLTNITIMYM